MALRPGLVEELVPVQTGWFADENVFDMQIERLPNPKGDRVKITMSGKFLPFKYYGNSGNVPEYGFKEE